jgi:hypothetical protein
MIDLLGDFAKAEDYSKAQQCPQSTRKANPLLWLHPLWARSCDSRLQYAFLKMLHERNTTAFLKEGVQKFAVDY